MLQSRVHYAVAFSTCFCCSEAFKFALVVGFGSKCQCTTSPTSLTPRSVAYIIPNTDAMIHALSMCL